MPWTLLARMLIRVLAGMFIWRTATGRRAAGRGVPAAAERSRLDPGATINSIREGARLGWRLVSLIVFLAAAAMLLSAGTTLTVLSPRWLGITLLVLALAAAVVAVIDLRGVLRILHARRRRREDQSLRARVS